MKIFTIYCILCGMLLTGVQAETAAQDYGTTAINFEHTTGDGGVHMFSWGSMTNRSWIMLWPQTGDVSRIAPLADAAAERSQTILRGSTQVVARVTSRTNRVTIAQFHGLDCATTIEFRDGGSHWEHYFVLWDGNSLWEATHLGKTSMERRVVERILEDFGDANKTLEHISEGRKRPSENAQR